MTENTPESRLEPLAPEQQSALAMELGFGKRKKFLVNRRQQLRSTGLVFLAVFVPLAFLNVLLYTTQEGSAAALTKVAPEMEEEVRAEDRARTVVTAVVSLLLLGSVILISIFETHKTAGAAFRVGRDLASIGDGSYRTRLRLRTHDNLRELEPFFNDMGRALEERAAADIEALDGLAQRLEESADATAVAAELRQLAAAKRRLLEA
jgi:methyl-accepting chemotaxis protein